MSQLSGLTFKVTVRGYYMYDRYLWYPLKWGVVICSLSVPTLLAVRHDFLHLGVAEDVGADATMTTAADVCTCIE